MKFATSLFVFMLLNCYFTANSQQWLDQKYNYDSILDIEYGSSLNFLGEAEMHSMDIYLPICSDPQGISKRPLILFIHGGAFLAGSKDDPSIQTLCKTFAKRGYVTAAINYRLGFVSDDVAWSCNFPNYNCIFATDSSEWVRACYRAIQDGKGALRYLINRHDTYRIDTNNVFLAGESAGGFISLGVGLMDVPSEKFSAANAISAVPAPNQSSLNCVYNAGKIFPPSINRPDLGGIEGSIEPSSINYTIKGIGNIFGGMITNLLAASPVGTPKPAIYSFHQPCDMVVPIDSAKIYSGLSWCMTNGYNCFGIANTPKVYGSRGFSSLNTINNHGYTIENHFTSTNFPFNFLFGPGSCADQVNNPCHAYDNFAARSVELAEFFAPLVNTNPICDTATLGNEEYITNLESRIVIFPNPANESFSIRQLMVESAEYKIVDQQGRILKYGKLALGDTKIWIEGSIASGYYTISIRVGNQIINRSISIFN